MKTFTFMKTVCAAIAFYAAAALPVVAQTFIYTESVSDGYQGGGPSIFAPTVDYTIEYDAATSEITGTFTLSEDPSTLEGVNPQVRYGVMAGFVPLQKVEGVDTYTYAATSTLDANVGEEIEIRVLIAWTGYATEIPFMYEVGSDNQGGTEPSDDEAPVLTGVTCKATTYNAATLAVTATDNSGLAIIEVYGEAECATLLASKAITADGSSQDVAVEGLNAETEYTFYVKAKDMAGNYAANVVEVKATTAEMPEVTETTYTGTVSGTYAGPGADIYAPEFTYALTHNPLTGQLAATVTLPEVPSLEGFTPQIRFSSTASFQVMQREGESATYTYTGNCDAEVGETIDVTVLFAWTGYSSEVAFKYEVGSDNQGGSEPSDDEAPLLASASLVSVTDDTASIAVVVTDDSGNATVEIYFDADCGDLATVQDVTADGSEQTVTIEGLEAGTEYTFYVKAKDAAGNYADDTLSVSATTTGGTTGIAAISGNDVRIYAAGGCLHVVGAAGQAVNIYAASGQLVYAGTIGGDDCTIALGRGVYVVAVDRTVSKVIM